MYISPDATMAALEEVSLNLINAQELSKAQKLCPQVKSHKDGYLPKNVVMAEVVITGEVVSGIALPVTV